MKVNMMGLNKRKKSYIGPYIVISFTFVAFFTSFIFLGLYSETQLSKPATEDLAILIIMTFALLVAGITAYAIWSSHITRKLRKAAEARKLDGKVFIRDRSTIFGSDVPTRLIFTLIPSHMQVGEENQADYVVETNWSEDDAGAYRVKGTGEYLNIRTKQRFCSVSIINRRATYIDEYTIGCEVFHGTPAPLEISIAPNSTKSGETAGSWPVANVANYVRSKLKK